MFGGQFVSVRFEMDELVQGVHLAEGRKRKEENSEKQNSQFCHSFRLYCTYCRTGVPYYVHVFTPAEANARQMVGSKPVYSEAPPSRVIVWPVINFVVSEASQTMASAISSASPKRRMGMYFFRSWSMSGRMLSSRSSRAEWV